MSINSTYADGIRMENITLNVYYKSDPLPSIVSVSKIMSSNSASIKFTRSNNNIIMFNSCEDTHRKFN